VQQLVLVEAAAAAVLAGWALRHHSPAAPGAGGVVAVLLLAVAVARVRGLALGDYLRARSAFRARRRRAAEARPDSGTDPALIPALECEPALRIEAHAFERRTAASARGTAPSRQTPAEHREIGMAGDGTFLSAVLQVEPRDLPLRPEHGSRPLPLPLLRAALRVDDIVLGSVQVVQYTRPAPAPHLPAQALAARAYQQVPSGPGTPGLRQTWVALRLDPEQSRAAVEARGGGEEGARKALQRAADQLAARLDEAGFRTTVLDAAGVTAAIATALCPNPLALSGAHGRAGATASGGVPTVARRSHESRRAWRCDDRWHTTFWVARWPQLARPGGPGRTTAPDLVGLLAGTPALATVFGLTVREAPAGAPGAAAVSAYVRLAARSESELAEFSKQLEGRAHSVGAGLVRLDMEQVPGVLATLPLGGTR